MALSLSCPCGAAFEVEDTFAGQKVSCPECQASVQAPALQRGPRRTSGLAVASLVLALVGAFTVVGTLAAVLCGLGALVSIARGGGRRAGAGFAVSGILLGVLFTGLSVFAYSRREPFGIGDQLREYRYQGEADFGGPLEIVVADQGFKITRPSEKWGRAHRELAHELGADGKLLLVNPAHDAYLDVAAVPGFGQSATALAANVVKEFEDSERQYKSGGLRDRMHRLNDVHVRENKPVKSEEGYDAAEVIIDARLMNQPITFLIQVVKKPRARRAYVVRSWTPRWRFAELEGELRRMIESLRILD